MSTLEIEADAAPAAERPVAAPATWSSQLAFLAAAVGSAVGLGSIWKFPYIVGANGGGPLSWSTSASWPRWAFR